MFQRLDSHWNTCTLLQHPLWESSPTPQNSSQVTEQLNSTGLTQENWKHSCIRRLVYGVHNAIPAERRKDAPPVQSRYVKCGLWRELNTTVSCNKKQHNNSGAGQQQPEAGKRSQTQRPHTKRRHWHLRECSERKVMETEGRSVAHGSWVETENHC